MTQAQQKPRQKKAASIPAPSSNGGADLTPAQIVAELDRYIIGQSDAKKAVAIALRNRWRRQQLPEELREEVLPKNILMIGPTGCGKTEISRRLAKLANSPFIKIEATKFTEVGYVGRDVEQIIRDLVETSIAMVKTQRREKVVTEAERATDERLLDALVGESASPETRDKFREKLKNGDLEEKEIDIEVEDSGTGGMPTFDVPGMPGAQMGMINLNDMLGGALGQRMKKRTLSVKNARKIIVDEESDKLVDQEEVIHDAITNVEQNGIVFLDEIDKICARADVKGGDVSREGVQRDLLPLIEGTHVSTKYGSVKTDHILFIASGAFHQAKPSDMLPELQGRLPIRVELRALTGEDFRRILTETEASLIKQYEALMGTEDLALSFEGSAIDALSDIAVAINANVENIGARRLHTVLEKVMEDISFTASENAGKSETITAKYVQDKLSDLAQDTDLSKFIL